MWGKCTNNWCNVTCLGGKDCSCNDQKNNGCGGRCRNEACGACCACGKDCKCTKEKNCVCC